MVPRPALLEVNLSSRREDIFPTLTRPQLERLRPFGRVRTTHAGEILMEAADTHARSFVVLAGALEILRVCDQQEDLITTPRPGQFTGELNLVLGRRGVVRIRVIEPGEVIELDHDDLLSLVQSDNDLSEILLRAFILRRVTTEDLAAAEWPLARPPHLLETSLPGVFAVGDVRGGNMKRVASAVGEGSTAIAFVHQVLHE